MVETGSSSDFLLSMMLFSSFKEEADIIIIHQTLQAIKDTQNPRVRMISDDTDVFVLLLHHYQKAGLDIPITMDSPIKDRASVDIQKQWLQIRTF